jgi:nucleotide-binding universal stress UspA family protein
MERKNFARPEKQKEKAMTSIIVSYDGTANENDALALGRIFGDAGSEVHVGYVRHSQELVSDQEAQQLLARATELYGGPLAGAHTVTNRSTPEGLASLAEQVGAQVVVFCSDSHTAPGHISIGNSAQRLLEGGPVAVAIAPAGLADSGKSSVQRIVAVGEAGSDGTAQATAQALATALGGEVVPVADEQSDLLVIASRNEAPQGRVSISSSAAHLVEIATCPVLVTPRGAALSFGRPVALSA